MIRAVVVGQEGVIAHLREVEPRVRGLLGQAVRAETINLVREAKIKVSGPVLRTRTDHLRTGINPQFEETETSITGSAGINSGKAKYPAVHEFGGTFTIRAHVRRLTQVFGRLLKSVLQVAVRAHSATFPERSYLRSSLRENEDRIKAALAAAVAKGVQG